MRRLVFVLVASSCAQPVAAPPGLAPHRATSPPAGSADPNAPDASAAGSPSAAAALDDADASVTTPAATPAACPADMILVDTTYCPNVELACADSEYDKPNHITICHRFTGEQRCIGPTRRQRFCIDELEYPNRRGAHPPVMVSWYDAAGACASRNKRLCWESEWVSSCEGPKKLPFPYGRERDHTQCNIDNPWVKPSLTAIGSPRADVAAAELLRLDQSVPSGAREGCVSGFGVRDLTGNFDEWVNAESHHGISKWAGLKGGAWGHVRNACRPMTTSHPPEFTYYFISFRCCADPAPDATADRDPTLWKPPPQHDATPPGGTVRQGWTTTERGPNRPR